MIEDYIKSKATGLCFHKDTHKDVIALMEHLELTKERFTLDYGDIKTGRSWGEVYDISGTIGRSTGSMPIPILMHNKRSSGGGGTLTHCIIKISRSHGDKQIWYKLYKNK